MEAEAFRAIYARYEARVHRFLLRLTGDRSIAEDLFQETWLAFARNANHVDPAADLAPFLFTIARNKFLNWRRWASLDLSRLSAFFRATPNAVADGSHAMDAREVLAAVEEAIADLPLASREVLLLVAVEGLDPSEAAHVLGLTPEATRQRLARARAQLARHLEQRGLRDLHALGTLKLGTLKRGER